MRFNDHAPNPVDRHIFGDFASV